MGFSVLARYQDETGIQLAEELMKVLDHDNSFIYCKNGTITLYAWSGVVSQVKGVVQEILHQELSCNPLPMDGMEKTMFQQPEKLGSNVEELRRFFSTHHFSQDYENWCILDTTVNTAGKCFEGLLARWYHDYDGYAIPVIVSRD